MPEAPAWCGLSAQGIRLLPVAGVDLRIPDHRHAFRRDAKVVLALEGHLIAGAVGIMAAGGLDIGGEFLLPLPCPLQSGDPGSQGVDLGLQRGKAVGGVCLFSCQIDQRQPLLIGQAALQPEGVDLGQKVLQPEAAGTNDIFYHFIHGYFLLTY